MCCVLPEPTIEMNNLVVSKDVTILGHVSEPSTDHGTQDAE